MLLVGILLEILPVSGSLTEPNTSLLHSRLKMSADEKELFKPIPGFLPFANKQAKGAFTTAPPQFFMFCLLSLVSRSTHSEVQLSIFSTPLTHAHTQHPKKFFFFSRYRAALVDTVNFLKTVP